MQRIFSVSWNCLKWTAFTAVVVACALGLYLYHNLNHEIRSYVEQKFASHYQDLLVSVRSARFVEGKGIEIRGLTLSQRSSAYHSQEIVSVDEIMVYCTTDPRRLASGDFLVEQIVARRPRLTATIDPQGRTNLQQLLPLPQWGDDSPDIEIVDASLLLADQRGGNVHRVLEDIDLQIKTEMAPGMGAYAGQKRRQKRIKATFKNQDWEAATLTGILDEEAQSFAVQGSIANLRIDDQLWEQIPTQWKSATEELVHLQAIANASFQASGDAAGLTNYLCTLDLRDGTWSDPRIPGSIDKIQARIIASPPGLRVERFVAYYDAGSVTATLSREGWHAQSPIHIAATLKNFSLHRGLARLLPQSMQRNWNRYQPSGTLDAGVRLYFDGKTWTPEIHANCRGTNFVFEEFPYPVSNARGKIDFKNKLLEVDLQANAGKARIAIVGTVRNPGPSGSGDGLVRIRSLDPIQWDTTFENALYVAQAEVCEVVRDFHIEGRANLDFTFHCDPRPDVAGEKSLRIDVVDATICHEAFPYPITKIRGPIVWKYGVVTIDRLEGLNDGGHIICQGTWRKDPASQAARSPLRGERCRVRRRHRRRDRCGP